MKIFNYVAVAAFALSFFVTAPAFADTSLTQNQAVYVAHEGCDNCGKCEKANKQCDKNCANCPKQCKMKALNLTPEQKQKATEIFKKAGKAKADVLTEEQKEAIKKHRASKQDRKNDMDRHPHHDPMGMPGVDLTEDQKTKFRAIDEKAMKEKEALLTDEQKSEMKKFHEDHKNDKKMGRRGKSRVPGVELSKEQKDKMMEIQKQADEEFRNILTDEQKQIFDNSRRGKRK